MTHPTVARFEVTDGELVIGGMRLSRLAARVGSTPFFAYDRSHITRRVDELRRALPDTVSLHYAVKANPMPAVVQHLAGLVDGLDVASGLELRTALDTPVDPQHVSFAGPGKRSSELEQAVAAGVLVEVESPTEADRLVRAGETVGVAPRAAVRVNPDFQLKGSGMRMGGGAQQFGVDAEAVPDLVAWLAERDVPVEGFHVFAGSQNLDAELISEGQRRTVDLIRRLSEKTSVQPRYLNLGGGFGIPYTARDFPLDLARAGASLDELVRTEVRPSMPEAEVVVELGRFLVGESGVYVTRVVDRKESRGCIFLVVDGGLHHQLAASGNFGQAIRRNYPLVIGNRMAVEPVETTSVVGCLCTPLDLLGDRVDVPRAEVGDLVVLFQAGAYGLTASPTAFLSHPAPAEILA